MEGSGLGILKDLVRDDGGKIQGSQTDYEPHYDALPYRFALGMAGFKGRTFHLARNEEWPSLDLQRQVFPFIESALYNNNQELRQQWIDICNTVMVDQSPAADMDEKPYLNNQGFVLTARHDFLLMLVRMRSIILQDAAAYIALFNIAKGNGRVPPEAGFESENPILNRDLFKSEVFITFQKRVEEAITKPEEPLPVMLAPEVMEPMRHSNRSLESIARSVRNQQEQLSCQPPQDLVEHFSKWIEFQQQFVRQQPCPQQLHPLYPQPPRDPEGAYIPLEQPEELQQPEQTQRLDSQQCAGTVAGTDAGSVATARIVAGVVAPGSFSALLTPHSQPVAPPQLTAQPGTPLEQLWHTQAQMQRQVLLPQTHLQGPVVEKPMFRMLKETDFSNDRHTSIQQIINEQVRFNEFKVRYRRNRQDTKIMKTLNNRARIVEEVKFIMDGPPRKTQAEAIDELANVLVPSNLEGGEMEHWKSINRLFKYCQAKKNERHRAKENEG